MYVNTLLMISVFVCGRKTNNNLLKSYLNSETFGQNNNQTSDLTVRLRLPDDGDDDDEEEEGQRCTVMWHENLSLSVSS